MTKVVQVSKSYEELNVRLVFKARTSPNARMPPPSSKAWPQRQMMANGATSCEGEAVQKARNWGQSCFCCRPYQGRGRKRFFPQIAIAIGVLTSNREGGRRTTLADWTWHRVPLQGAADVLPLLGPRSTLGEWTCCHCWVAMAPYTAMASRKNIQKNCLELLADVTLFFTLITQKLFFAMWGLCWYSFYFSMSTIMLTGLGCGG